MVEMKWVDLFPGKQHEFGERIRVLGHARMNDGAVRLYYETIEDPEEKRREAELAAIIGGSAKEGAKKTEPEPKNLAMIGGRGFGAGVGEDPKKAERGSKKEK